MPYTPILNIRHVLQSTLYLIEHTDYPHKGHAAIEHVKSSLGDALAAIDEVEQLQAEATRLAEATDTMGPSEVGETPGA
jgi:hypothetical protein